MIKLEINGVPFTNFLSLSVTRSMENFSGSFNFKASNADRQRFPIRKGSACKITYYNSKGAPTVLLTGFVEVITPSIDDSNHDITIQGRDRTGDLIDSTLSQDSVQFSATPTLVEIIQKVMQSVGVVLPIINNAGTIDAFAPYELVAGQAGQGAFDFLEKQARRRQVLLTTDGGGNVVITRTGTVNSGFKLLNQLDDPNNNVLSASASYDDTKRYNKYICVAQKNLTGQNPYPADDADNEEELVSVSSEPVYDTEIRAGRTLVLVAENATTSDELTQRAQWEANIRKARSASYKAVVQGFENPANARMFKDNELYPIVDYDNAISATMLAKELTYNVDESGGTKTTFTFVDKNAYSLELNEPTFDAVNQVGDDFDA